MSPISEEKYIDEIKPRVKRAHWSSMFLLLLIIPVIGMGAQGTFIPEGEAADEWFQRSGSILVALGAIVQFLLLSVHDAVYPSGVSGTKHREISKRFQRCQNPISTISFIVLSVGTLIWGYGDLLFKYI